MRTTKIKLLGNEYTLCCSTRFVVQMEETHGTFQDFLNKLVEGKAADKLDALEEMLRAGFIYDTREGMNPPEPPSREDILDGTALDDFAEINNAVFGAIAAGNERKVEAKPSKKGSGATQAE